MTRARRRDAAATEVLLVDGRGRSRVYRTLDASHVRLTTTTRKVRRVVEFEDRGEHDDDGRPILRQVGYPSVGPR